VSTHSSAIQQLSDEIDLMVSEIDELTGDEIVSRINMSSSEILISASRISLVGDITANGNVHINTDGTIVAMNGVFNGRLQLPFKWIYESDAYVDNDTNPSFWTIANDVNLIHQPPMTSAEAGANQSLPSIIKLPVTSSYNGVVVSIFNANPTSNAGITSGTQWTRVQANDGSAFFDNNSAAGKSLDVEITWVGGMMQFLGINFGSGVRWMVLNRK